jgi:hypothetical protein
MNNTIITGGCYCGMIRFAAIHSPLSQSNCHCSNCRRAVGAQAVAWITVRRSGFRFDQGTPKTYRTETGALRTFCENCGTSLTYEIGHRPDEIDVTTGSLDHPELFPPQEDSYADEKLPWVNLVPENLR